jgi:hypothetical protein
MNLTSGISKKDPYGLGGWLLLVWVLLLFQVVQSIFFEGLGRVLIYLLELSHFKELTLHSCIVISYRILEVAFSCYLMLLIIKQDHKAVLLTKLYSVLVYIHGFAIVWAFNSAFSQPMAVQVAQAAVFAIPLPLALYMYLIKSKRVLNTFMFAALKLPVTIQCPFCLENLELEESERVAKEVTCPECNNHISQKCFAA